MKLSDRHSRLMAIAIVVLAAVAVTGIPALRIIRGRQPHVEVDRGRYPVVGLDLSAHNGRPDFDSVAAAGVDFVYLKASEGVSFRDPAFARNITAAAKAGLKVGAYHFFRFDCDGRRQAINLLSATDSLALDLPLAIDVEESGNPPVSATRIIIERLETMVATLRSAGRRVIVYTNKNGNARFLSAPYLTEEAPELWICSFTNPPLAGGRWKLWQHSHRAHVPGIRGKVDMNTFNGSREDFLQWHSAPAQ